jgi:hypothetical protein
MVVVVLPALCGDGFWDGKNHAAAYWGKASNEQGHFSIQMIDGALSGLPLASIASSRMASRPYLQ